MDGSRVYLGLSERDELRVLDKLRVRFISWWLLLGAARICNRFLHDAQDAEPCAGDY